MARGYRAVLAVLVVIWLAGVATASERRVFILSDSVATVDSLHIFPGTDSLWLNNRRLVSPDDYVIEGTPSRVTLRNFKSTGHDTLAIVYTRWPSWLLKTWGEPIEPPATTRHQIPNPSAGIAPLYGQPDNSNLKISGAKTFRVTNGPGVGSAFGQSLDLGITGELAPGVQLSGAISDRGYDPINGYANARLEEFDRVHLRLTSAHFVGQAGDITIRNFSPLVRSRDVSGGSARLSFPNYTLFGVAARPRGRFQSVKLSGNDGFQGPYQPTGAILAIVPNSEQVWLDGRLLERGADKDYAIDYPTGRITFGVSRPIDSRSRIEIDFEPASTPYRQELLSSGGEVRSRDSSRSLAVTWTREGDDKSRPLVELGADDQSALGGAEDSIVTRSGVRADTLGAYELALDSLSDSVWRYVGPGNGDASIVFSYVGSKQGKYRYLGNDQYAFVGSGQGEYDPVILLRPARRTETAQVTGRMPLFRKGSMVADVRFSRTNFNLWNPNLAAVDGSYHVITARQGWNWHGQASMVTVRRQYLDAAYSSATRFDEPDVNRLFLVPVSLSWSGHRIRHDVDADLALADNLQIHPLYNRLSYGNRFASDLLGSDVTYRPTGRLTLYGVWRDIAASYTPTTTEIFGDGRVASGKVSYDIGQTSLESGIEFDRRTNSFSGTLNGTKYVRQTVSLRNRRTSIVYEGYQEDSLSGSWNRILNRRRVSASTEKSLGNWRTNGSVTHQWLDLMSRQERTFLGRINVAYDNQAGRLSMGSGYTLSDERRNARGYTYLQVDPGRGNYRYEDGRYIADPFGDYIRMEEILSDSQRVRRGEKTFRFSKQTCDFVISAGSQISEELLAEGQRPWWWVIPFASDENSPYLSSERRYEVESKLISWRGIYAFNISASDSRKSRLIVGENRVRQDFRVRVVVREPIGNLFLEQGGESFTTRRDLFFGDAGRSDGWRAFIGSKRSIQSGEIMAELGYRRASGSVGSGGGREGSELIGFKSGVRVAVVGRGEMKLDTEAYRQTLSDITGIPSTVLTDNHEGLRGFNWVLSVRYGLSRSLRLNLALNGRYSDNRPGRLFARTEMTAEF